MIELKNISVNYGGVSILENISITFDIKGLVGVIGENGQGKSTLLKTIIGDVENDGTVEIAGKSRQYSNLSKEIAVCYSGRPMLTGLTSMEIIEMGRYPYKNSFEHLNQNDHNIIKEWVGYLGIDSLLQREFNTLSDGEAQKVMLARTLVQDTPVMLLDEPSASLDLKQKDELYKLLKSISKDKLVVCVSHDVRELLKYADEVVLVKNREVQKLPSDANERKKLIENEFGITL